MYSCTSKAHVKLKTVTATRPRVLGDLRGLGGAVFFSDVSPLADHVWPINCFAPLAMIQVVREVLVCVLVHVRGRVRQNMVQYTIDGGEKGKGGEIFRRNEVSKRRGEVE
jgi:hypothetical protein